MSTPLLIWISDRYFVVIDRVVAKFFDTGDQWGISVLNGKAFEMSPPALSENGASAAVAARAEIAFFHSSDFAAR
jgi:hypothetical protein